MPLPQHLLQTRPSLFSHRGCEVLDIGMSRGMKLRNESCPFPRSPALFNVSKRSPLVRGGGDSCQLISINSRFIRPASRPNLERSFGLFRTPVNESNGGPIPVTLIDEAQVSVLIWRTQVCPNRGVSTELAITFELLREPLLCCSLQGQVVIITGRGQGIGYPLFPKRGNRAQTGTS